MHEIWSMKDEQLKGWSSLPAAPHLLSSGPWRPTQANMGGSERITKTERGSIWWNWLISLLQIWAPVWSKCRLVGDDAGTDVADGFCWYVLETGCRLQSTGWCCFCRPDYWQVQEGGSCSWSCDASGDVNMNSLYGTLSETVLYLCLVLTDSLDFEVWYIMHDCISMWESRMFCKPADKCVDIFMPLPGQRHHILRLSIHPSFHPCIHLFVTKFVNTIRWKQTSRFWCSLAQVACRTRAWNNQL